MKEKNIGDKVWWATCGIKSIKKDCPICFRKRQVTLILGNGEQVTTSCDYCVRGFSEPYGTVEEYERVSGVKEIEITGKEVRETNDDRSIEYRYSDGIHNYCLYVTDIFETQEEAEKRVQEMIKEYEDSEVERLAYKKKSNQTHYSWSVGYHKKQIKDAQSRIDFSKRKIEELNQNEKTP